MYSMYVEIIICIKNFRILSMGEWYTNAIVSDSIKHPQVLTHLYKVVHDILRNIAAQETLAKLN